MFFTRGQRASPGPPTRYDRSMENDIEIWLEDEGEAFIEGIGIGEGQIVLDFGCGSGHYSIPATNVVGEEGRVYTVDQDEKSLQRLKSAARSAGLENIVSIFDQSDDVVIDLEDESVDVMLLYDVLHYMELEKRRSVYENARRVLQTDAILSVYPKHSKSDEPLWNLADMELGDVIGEIESAGFHLERKSFARLVHDENFAEGYVLNFRKTA